MSTVLWSKRECGACSWNSKRGAAPGTADDVSIAQFPLILITFGAGHTTTHSHLAGVAFPPLPARCVYSYTFLVCTVVCTCSTTKQNDKAERFDIWSIDTLLAVRLFISFDYEGVAYPVHHRMWKFAASKRTAFHHIKSSIIMHQPSRIPSSVALVIYRLSLPRFREGATYKLRTQVFASS